MAKHTQTQIQTQTNNYNINYDQNIPVFLAKSFVEANSHPAWIRRLEKKKVESFSYSDIYKAVEALKNILHKKGIKKDDIVAILASNGPEWGVAAMATWQLGAIVAPVHHGNSHEEIDEQIVLLTPKVILTYRNTVAFNEEFRIDIDKLIHHFSELKEEEIEELDFNKLDIQPDHEALRVYTSGSTGNSKMVRLSHLNLVANATASRDKLFIRGDDVFLSLLPLSHAFELTTGFLVPLSLGSSIVIPRVLAAKEIMSAMNENNVSAMVAVPRLFRSMYQTIEKQVADGGFLIKAYVYVLSLLPLPLRKKMNAPIRKKIAKNARVWVSGGAALDPEVTKGFHRLGFSLMQGYGLTETSPVLSVQDEFDPDCLSVGSALPGVELKIHQSNDEGCGEIWVKGSNVMLGYTDDKINQEVFEDGYFKTGDLGYIDDKNRLVLTGRKKRLIVTDAGKNVYPEDIEVKLERFPRVKEAAIVECKMKPVAVISLNNNGESYKETEKIEEAEPILNEKRQYAKKILNEYNQHASKHNQVTRYAVVEELPHTPLGKIAYKELIQVFTENEFKE